MAGKLTRHMAVICTKHMKMWTTLNNAGCPTCLEERAKEPKPEDILLPPNPKRRTKRKS